MQQVRHTGVIRFGQFEVDRNEGVLRKAGLPVRLQTQPFQVLAALLEKPGMVVTREELSRRLWAEDTFVDFEHGLNAAVTRLRQALGDSAAKPRYIETLAKRGYRFIGHVEEPAGASNEHPSASDTVPVQRLRIWIAAAAVVLLAGAGALYFVPRPGQPVIGKPEPLTAFRGIEAQPALSPDGNHVAFTWNGEGQDNFDIYVMPVPAGTPVRLSSDPAEDVYPAWSPDGRTIAFLRKLGGEFGALMLVPAAGGAEHKLREIWDKELLVSSTRSVSLSWSPDGHWIAASHRESKASGEGLHLFSLNGDSRRLTSPRGYLGDHMPAFSPDGRSLAFCRMSGYIASEICLLPLGPNFEPAGEVRRLTTHKQWSSRPGWIDGQTIMHAVSGEVRTIDLSDPDTPSREIPLSDVSELFAGRHLVYSRWTHDANIWRTKLLPVGDSPPPPELFISSTREDSMPRYSPDGKKIAFTSGRSGSNEIWISKADSSSPVRLTFFNAGMVGTTNWSPDGQSLVFHARPEGQADLFVIPAAGGSSKRLTEDPADDAAPSYSRDGQWIYFTSRRSGQHDIWKMPAAGGKAVQLTWTGGARPVESVDRKRIYYRSKDAKEILSIPVEAGRPEKVTGPTHDWPLDFTVTAQGLYYPAPPHSGRLRFIRFLDFATGQSRPVAVANNPLVLGISVSPDGRYLLFDQLDQSNSDLMLVKDFRVH